MYKKIIQAFLISVSIFTAAKSYSVELSPEARLRKMSLIVRGVPPEKTDIIELKVAIASQQTEEFFKKIAKKYSSSNWAKSKLAEKISENIRIPISSIAGHTENSINISNNQILEPTIGVVESLDDISLENQIMYQLQKNLSFDEILQSDSAYKEILLNRIRNRLITISRALRSQKLNSVDLFWKKALEFGFKKESESEIRLALEDIRKNPNKYNDLKTLNYSKNGLDVIIDILSKKKSEKEKDFVKLIKKIKSDGVVNVNGQTIKTDEGTVGDIIKINPSVDSSNSLTFQAFDLQTSSFFSIKLNSEDSKPFACAVLSLSMGSILGSEGESSILGENIFFGLCPRAKADLEKGTDLDILTKLHSGFFEKESISKVKEYINKEIVMRKKYGQNLIGMSSSKIPLFENTKIIDRYSKTPYSQSAAFHQIFMCDEMKLVAIVDDLKKTEESFNLFKFLNPDVRNKNNIQNNNKSEKEDHVKGQCQSCHKKLDPIKQIFDGDKKVNTWAYDDYKGQTHQIKFKDQNDFLKQIVMQNQYKRCQVEKFWNWYVGEDAIKSESTVNELIKFYEDSKADPAELISFMVLRKEFYSDESVVGLTPFSAVRPIFQRCQSCHSGESLAPMLTQTPFSFSKNIDDSKREHLSTLKNIIELSDINHEKGVTKMPPKDAGWSLSNSEKTLIRRWIWDGARDESNRSTLSVLERDKLFAGVSKNIINDLTNIRYPVSTFNYTWKRYLENYDFAKTVGRILPDFDVRKCYNAIKTNGSAAGIKNSNTGRAASDQPTTAYRSMIEGCLNSHFSSLMKTNLDRLSQRNLDFLGEKIINNIDNKKLDSAWSSLSIENKNNLANFHLDQIIGANVLASSHQSALINYLVTLVDRQSLKNNNLTVINGSAYMAYVLLNREEFLTF
jgi:hypothetical protein